MVDELRELVRREHEQAKESERLHRLDAEVAELRRRVEEIGGFFAAERDEERRLRLAEEEAGAEAERRTAEVATAEDELARAANETERTLAEQRLTRARDHLHVAGLAAERAVEARAALELEAAELAAELPRLEQRAGELAAAIPGETAFGDDTDLVEWTSRARAALFVAASDIDARRELAIREANELASSLLGESTYGSTPEQALARVERHWTSRPGHVSESR
jgi:chromosome segregation ATPase